MRARENHDVRGLGAVLPSLGDGSRPSPAVGLSHGVVIQMTGPIRNLPDDVRKDLGLTGRWAAAPNQAAMRRLAALNSAGLGERLLRKPTTG